jgi:hypothetical protein
MTKLATATEIAKTCATKQEAIEKIVATMGVSKANAFVYFTKIQKILGDMTPPSIRPKAEAACVETDDDCDLTNEGNEPAGTNPITGLTPNKRAKKVKVIDTFIEEIKAAGPQSPLPI